jgi:anaerobic dimethyl sulfoxide reductase subunit B
MQAMTWQYGFYFNVNRCVQCHACEVACKAANSVELGVRWRRVVQTWDGLFPNITNKSVSISCMHCGKPACAAVCPADAITKRAEDGIVVVDQGKCIGCHTCITACPFGVPQYGKDGTMQKCNLCLERVVQGKQPACAATCPGEALHFGTMEELSKHITEDAARKLVVATEPSLVITFSK